jgi:hypothetical protein
VNPATVCESEYPNSANNAFNGAMLHRISPQMAADIFRDFLKRFATEQAQIMNIAANEHYCA